MSVQVRRDGRVGRILLNRPRALNALDDAMIAAIAEALHAWRTDPAVHAVVIEGAGGRAFCAGGDIRMVRQLSLDGDAAGIERFFAAEYALNLAIATHPKPYVALVDGICMGGGIGVSVHGSVRVATEAALFAMPETGIGFFPDVGASHVLPRLPGAVGRWLGLTGARLEGANAVLAGIATHFVPRAALPALSEALAIEGVAAVARFAQPPDGQLTTLRPAIDRCFGAADVAGILARLEAEPGEWAAGALQAMRAASPSAVCWSLALLQAGAGRDLAGCLEAELALTRKATRHPDFLEGVRAMVVDKDRTPRWSPGQIEDVDLAGIAAMVGV